MITYSSPAEVAGNEFLSTLPIRESSIFQAAPVANLVLRFLHSQDGSALHVLINSLRAKFRLVKFHLSVNLSHR